MKPGFSNILLVVFAVVIYISCSKGGSSGDGTNGQHIVTTNDTIAPEITVFTPTANQVFANGNVIGITGRITDDLGLYRGTIKMINDANGNVLLNQAYEIHGLRLYNFSINHTTSVTSASDYTVTISFEDHGSNITSKSVKVKVNP